MAASSPDLRSRRLLGVAIAVLVGLLGFLVWMFARLESGPPRIVPPEAGRLTWVRSIYGYGPNEEDRLLNPTSVAIAPDGDIYVTDPVRSRVVAFTPAGGLRRIIRSDEPGYLPGSFIRPEALDVDPVTGDLYIADSWARKIVVYDEAGEWVREWQVERQARGVAVAEDRVFVLDVGTVIAYTKSGQRLYAFGERGREPGAIDAYQGIAVDSEQVLIADSYNRRLQAFDYEGELSWAHPSQAPTGSPVSAEETVAIDPETGMPEGLDGDGAVGDGEGGRADGFRWDLPQDLVVDGAGRLVVVDAFRFELVVADRAGGQVRGSYGEFGRMDGQFFYPSSVAYDPDRDWFVVADTQNDRVQIVRIPGSAGGALPALRRAAASPWRYALIPLALLAVAIVLSVRAWRRVVRAPDEVPTSVGERSEQG